MWSCGCHSHSLTSFRLLENTILTYFTVSAYHDHKLQLKAHQCTCATTTPHRCKRQAITILVDISILPHRYYTSTTTTPTTTVLLHPTTNYRLLSVSTVLSDNPVVDSLFSVIISSLSSETCNRIDYRLS